MGKILLYKAGKAVMAYLCAPTTSSLQSSVKPFKLLDGTEVDYLFYGTGGGDDGNLVGKNARLFNDCTVYASEDTENDFSLDHYTTREISNLSYSRTSSAQLAGRIYTIQITNNGASSVDVGSLKFTKVLRQTRNANYSAGSLMFGYFFDAPVTIDAGETKTFAINFES